MRHATALIASLFVVSGATALVGQVVWMRMLGLVLGNTVWAASVVVAVWMLGMALGAAAGARLAPRVRRHLVWYGLAEAGIGVFLALSPFVADHLVRLGALVGPDLSSGLGVGLAQRFALSAAALLPPTVLMGLTLPLLVERVRGTNLAGKTALLYGLNTLGAAAGVFLTAYLLLPWLGERGALAAAAVACSVVAGFAILLEERVHRPEARPRRAPEARPAARVFLVLVGVMGFAALAAELLWVRILVLHLGSRVYAFALLLGVYLTGLALGSMAVRLLARRLGDPHRTLALLQLLAGVMLCLQLAALGGAGDVMAWIAGTVQPRATFAALQLVMLAAVAVAFLPVTFLFGASFPLAVAADPAARSDGGHVGRVAAANTVGAIVGAIAGPFLITPALGCQRALLVLALVHVAVAVGLLPARRTVLAALAPLALVLGLWIRLPADWVLRQAEAVVREGVTLIELREGLGATVVVKEYREPSGTWRSLELNGLNVAGTDPALLTVQQLQGNLPLLQVESARRVLHVGFGSGGTCWAVSRHPVERIDVVEISPEVIAAAGRWFSDVNHGVLHDPRVRVIVNDGRNFLLATRETYDVILSDSIHPLYAGNSTLYTREYFELCRSRLEPGGVVSMWLPLYSLDRESFLRILRAFHEVFPHTVVWYDSTTVNENTVVTGRLDEGPISIDWERLADEGVMASVRVGGIETSSELLATLLLGPADVARLTGDIPPLTDDLPYVEYISGRLLERDRSWLSNLSMLVAARTTENPFKTDGEAWALAVSIRDGRLKETLRTLAERVEHHR